NSGATLSIFEPLIHDTGLGGTADGGLTKNGPGNVTLNSVNTYTGPTVVNAGTLALAGSGSISTSPTITLVSGATLDGSGRSDTTVTIPSGQTLAGSGSVVGNLTIASGGTL